MLWACGGEQDGGSSGADGGDDGVGGQGVGGQGAGAGGGFAGTPDPQYVPTPTGACPTFVDGIVTVQAAGLAARQVQLWLDSSATEAGPLVFYWHGAGSSPTQEPPYGLGEAFASIQAAGGVVAALFSDPAAGQFEWYLTTGAGPEDDLVVADEVVACALEQGLIDVNRIHSIGMSAGGLNTVQMAYRRSGYVASAVPYSGGLLGQPTIQDATNLLPMVVFHGGPGDQVIINFEDTSNALYDDLRARGAYATICNHGLGHDIPKGQGEQAAIWQFFVDHPFGTQPSPYAAGPPVGFPPYCVQ